MQIEYHRSEVRVHRGDTPRCTPKYHVAAIKNATTEYGTFHVNEIHAIHFTSPQDIAPQTMKAMKVSLFKKQSIADHNGNTIYVGLSMLDVPVISVCCACAAWFTSVNDVCAASSCC